MKQLASIIFLLLFQFATLAQGKLEVVRTKAMDRYAPVTNVFVTEDGNTWAGNQYGLFQILSPDQSQQVPLLPSEWSLLQTPSGNYDLRLPLENLLSSLGEAGAAIRDNRESITAATFDAKKQELWIGTSQYGLFQLKTSPALRLVQRHHTGNSKLASDQIHALLLDNRDRLWIGTEQGCVFGKDGKWKLEEKYFSINAFAQNEANMWVMGNDLLWRVDAREMWEPIDIDASLTEGEVADIAFDNLGQLWIASQIMARFDPETEETELFGPAREFTSQDVSCLAVGADNTLWIGTNDKGLYAIRKSDLLSVACSLEKPVSCGNVRDAAIKVTVSNGTAPYSYDWGNPQLSGPNPSQLGPGDYTVTVTDANGKSNLGRISIPDPNMTLIVKAEKQADEKGEANGSASVRVQGGTPPYSYAWDNGENTAVANQLSGGNHTVTITDKTGCSAIGSLSVDRKIGKLDARISQSAGIKCAGEKTAVLKAEISGGKPPFSVSWNDGNTAETLQFAAAGNYSVTVTDALGSSAVSSFSVQEPKAISLSARAVSPATHLVPDGKAVAQAAGGTGQLSYRWSNGSTGPAAEKMTAGEHYVTVTDQSGCLAIANVLISEDILPLSAQIDIVGEIRCNGDQSMQLAVIVNGGKRNYSYSWNDGNTQEKRENLPAGNYSVTVTDITGVSAVASVSVKEPAPISIAVKADNAASTGKADGKATAKVSGGSGNFSYRWENGETGATAVKLLPGNNGVTVTDQSGCSATATILVTENILPLKVEVSQSAELRCAGDKTAAISAAVFGGKPPFRISWSEGSSGETASGLSAGSYSVTVSDGAGSSATGSIILVDPQPLTLTLKGDAPASSGNSDGKATAKATGGSGNYTWAWSHGETSATASKLAPGEHRVTVTDKNGCSASASISVSENILPLIVQINQTSEIRCAGEQAAALAADVSGGKAPFQYNWTGGGEEASLGDLAAGTYQLVVTDAAGNTASTEFRVSEPAALSLEVNRIRPATTDKQKNGKAAARASGGKAPYAYRWASGETADEAAALATGTQDVTVQDANGCQASASFEITPRIIPELSAENLRDGEIIKLEKIYFQPDSTRMEANSIPTVDELYLFLSENPGIVIEVGGHTNGIPPHDFCDKLSAARAKSVAQYLVDKGIPASRITYRGYGKRNPIASNATPEGRAKNQRVEIKIVRVNGG
jgi:outer membrane protein OmpA-like peptidoglycan-associated protein